MSAVPEREELVALLRELFAEGRQEDLIALVLSILTAMDQHHAEQLWKLRRQVREVHARKSEKLDSRQLELLEQLIDRASEASDDPERSASDYEVDEAQPADPERISAKRQKARRRRVLDRLPPDLPREAVVIPVPEPEVSCPACGETRTVIGHQTSEMLEYTPGHFRVVAHEREKRACGRCADQGVVTAPPPPKVTERGAYGAGLISHVVVAKYNDHLPLYRQSQQYKREQVPLPRSTLGDLVADAAHELRPVAEAIRSEILTRDLMQTDDTGLRVLTRDGDAKRLRGHLWPYLSGKLVYVDYTPTREGAGPQEFLASYRGYLQVDGYAGYQALFAPDSGRVEVACWAHTRRYFHWAEETGDERALEMLGLIASLYPIERSAREQGLDPPGRRALRQEAALPILEEIRAWLDKRAPEVPPRSELGKAIRYTHRRMVALRRYVEDGRLEIDNNRAERLIRGIAVGRRNYLFAGSHVGAERAACLYGLIWSARLHELEPRAYLQGVLEAIAAGWPQRKLRALLPDAWLEAHPEALRTTRPA